jgi:hypothetical protein
MGNMPRWTISFVDPKPPWVCENSGCNARNITRLKRYCSTEKLLGQLYAFITNLSKSRSEHLDTAIRLLSSST